MRKLDYSFLDIKEKVIIYDTFKKLIQNGRYEYLILDIMNNSKKLFPNKYEHIESQSKGECDFRDIKTSQKYDVKLLITKEQGNLIGSRNNNFEKWIQTMFNELEEFNKYINIKENFDIESLTFYKIIYQHLNASDIDEDLIFFIPFTISLDSVDMISSRLSRNVFSTIFLALNKNNLINNRKIYIIYPSLENKIVIKCLNTTTLEFLEMNELNNYIKFEFY